MSIRNGIGAARSITALAVLFLSGCYPWFYGMGETLLKPGIPKVEFAAAYPGDEYPMIRARCGAAPRLELQAAVLPDTLFSYGLRFALTDPSANQPAVTVDFAMYHDIEDGSAAWMQTGIGVGGDTEYVSPYIHLHYLDFRGTPGRFFVLHIGAECRLGNVITITPEVMLWGDTPHWFNIVLGINLAPPHQPVTLMPSSSTTR